MFLQDAQAHLKIVGHMQTRATTVVRAYSQPLLHKTMNNVSMIITPPDKSAYFCFGIFFSIHHVGRSKRLSNISSIAFQVTCSDGLTKLTFKLQLLLLSLSHWSLFTICCCSSSSAHTSSSSISHNSAG